MEEMMEEAVQQLLLQAKIVQEVTNKMLNEEFCKEIAESKKRMLDAYIAAGFYREEAMRLLVNDKMSISK